LINWYSVHRRVRENAVSRGEVVDTVRGAATPDFVDAALARLSLKRINPFRLIGIFPSVRQIVEWRWNLQRLTRKPQRWTPQQWISSGYDEPAAQRVRSRIFRHARRQRTAGTLEWLRRLHRSHAPDKGPFSTCMHRADAVTVSCTEVTVSARIARMRYHPGAPCQCAAGPMRSLPRKG
jgi:hypothetical protein